MTIPIYEYKCMTCKKVSEVWVKDSEREKKLIDCPECGQDAKKQMSVTRFKVNGFSEKNGYAGSK